MSLVLPFLQLETDGFEREKLYSEEDR